MKRKQLLMTLLLALVVPLAAFAQVERTVTVYNGTDKECHVPLYGNVTRMDDLSYSQFIMDKSVLQAAGLTGKEITKMTLHLANSVPASYEWTTKRRTVVTLAEVDASQMDGGFIQDMTNSTNVFADYLDAHGETMEISFGTPFNYSGEKNLLVQFREEYMYYFNYHPFASYRLPMYYGVYKTGASHWKQLRASNNYSTVSSLNCHFVPKTTFTYLTEANWANTNAPKNAITQSDYSTGNNNSISYYIRMDWDAADNYTGNYQVLCVPRGTTPLDWSTAATTSETYYSFGGLEKNTAYDLYVRAKSLFFTSNVATASATTPFYPANLDEDPLTFDFNSQTMPNGLDFDCSIPRYLSAYGRLSYCNLGTNYVGATVYNDTPPVTITLPELKFTNANNGLMLEFDLQGVGWEVHNFHTAELQVKIYDYGYDEEVFSDIVSASYPSQHFTFRLPDLTTSNYHIYKLSFSYAGGPGFGLDNIVVRKAPNIMPPYNLAASEITPTSAKISWADDNTNSHTFDLVYRPKGYNNNPDSWEHYVVGVTSPYTLTGLTPYTDYEVKVKTITSSAYEDSEILEFSTLCTPAGVPYNEPFTGLTTLPTDWRVNVPEYAEVVREVDNGRLTMHNTVTEVTEYYYDYPFTHTLYSDFSAYIILPYFNNLGSLQLSFKAGRTQGALESLQVGVVADPKNYVSFTQIGTATLTDNANGEVYSFNLVNNAVQNGHIVIRLYNSDDVVQSIWLDNFSVQQYAAPTDLEVSNVTNTSATLGWNAGAATEWEVKLGENGAWVSVPDNPTYTFSGLNTDTEYVAYVRAKYGEGLYSTEVISPSFKTLMQAPVAMNENNPTYSQDFNFINIGHGWMFLNVPRGDSDDYGWYWGNIGTTYSSRYCIYISDDGGTSNNYFVGNSYELPNGNQGYLAFNETTVYAVKTFDLASGQYTFQYDYRVKGVANKDYARVALVPANIALQGIYAGCPSGLSSTTLPEGWIALDGGTPLPQYESTATWSTKTEQYTVLAPGNYMMVFIWHQDAGSRTHSAVQRPIAIDNVRVTWSSLVYPPTVAALHPQVTDTEAPLAMYAPEQGIAPTSYEVQYEPAAAVNTYEGAPIATFNVTETPQTVTLTGLTPLTLYSARVRSVYTANGHSVYSDWQYCPNLFTTLCTRPTHLVVVGQTSSWANVRWNPVEMTLPEGQYINYCVQLTTDLNDWGEEDCGWASDSWEKNLAPGTYHFRVRTAVYQEEGNLYMGGSDWSDPITFTIAPWTDPVTIFPLTYDFEEWSNHFADGLTLDGDYENLDILTYGVSDVPTPEEGDNEYALRFRSTSNSTACLVLPPLRPSTSSALVSFWWYHNSSDNNAGEGVVVEYSSDGSSWTSFGDVIPRYAAQTGWVKYQKVVPTLGTNASYIRLRFIGSSSNQWSRYCYLDDLKVYAFKSEQPYISYVGCDSNSATITLYDYAVENGYHSSQFEVQYREWRDPSETPETWADYDVFVNQEPYTFENTLTVNGLQPATCYEFRARARVSYGGYNFDWSGYCEPVRQWTDCGTYTITPSYTYTEDFEDEFYLNCWTGDIDETGWHLTTDDAHSGTMSLNCTTNSKTIQMPEIDLTNLSSTNDNVVLRFWANNASLRCRIIVYVGSSEEGTVLYDLPKTNGWRYIELSLSSFMGNVIRIEFVKSFMNACYIDELDIVANPYPNTKIFDKGSVSSSVSWSDEQYWYPHSVPTINDDVRILGGEVRVPNNFSANAKSIVVGAKGQILVWLGSLNVAESFSSDFAKINRNNNGVTGCPLKISSAEVNIQDVTVVDANSIVINGASREGILNITGTLTPGETNSVVVKDGGVLNATIINGTTSGGNDKIRIESGGQVKSGNDFYGIIEKNITGYGAANADTPTGWNLIATPALVSAVQTFVPQSGSEYQFDQMDIYRFTGGNELEWDNFKCPFEGGCDSPFGTIPQGQFSAELGQPLKGYLYALQEDATIQFVAGPVGDMPFLATNVDTDVNLTCYNTPDDASLNGWNLIGNPYTCNAYLKQDGNYIPFYKMNDTGDAIVGVAAGTPIKPCEAVFVCCTVPSSTVTFTTTEPAGLGNAPEDPMIQLPTHVLYEDQDATMTTTVTQTIELAEGWNWFSTFIVADDPVELLDMLKEALGENGLQIQAINGAVTEFDGEEWFGDLDEEGIFNEQAYLIQTSAACEITMEGTPAVVDEYEITINLGWNWIGFPSADPIDVIDALIDFEAEEGDQIQSIDATSTEFDGEEWFGDLETFTPGQGYMYYSTSEQAKTLVFSTAAKKKSNKTIKQ